MSAPREGVALSALLNSLLQKSYHDLTVLSELLPRKSDLERKIEIVQFARRTRLLVIRLLALVKWAGNSSSVQLCSEMSELLSQRSWLYMDTANRLVHLSRNVLTTACTPNFSLATALDVLSTGTYPRLPTIIRERTVPPSSLSPEETLSTAALLECTIRHRLLHDTVPPAMTVRSIDKGLVTFVVPYEFELKLSVVGDDLALPWRLVALKILVGEALPERPLLVHRLQLLYLHQLLQSRLFAGEEGALTACYHCLHAFCLALQLDCLNSQVQRLSSDTYGGYVKVEEYSPGSHMKVAYWRSSGSSQFLSAFLLNQAKTSSWPRVTITADPSTPHAPFSTSHSPPLSGTEEAGLSPRPLSGLSPSPLPGLSPSFLSFERLLDACVAARSRALLTDLRATLAGSPWHEHALLEQCPPSLRISVPVKHGRWSVLLGVDRRVGHVVAHIEPPAPSSCPAPLSPPLRQALSDVEQAVAGDRATLPSQLDCLQCQLFLHTLSEMARELNLEASPSLPLTPPLTLPSSSSSSPPSLLFVALEPFAYLVVAVKPGLIHHYYLLQVEPSSPPLAVDAGLLAPQTFLRPSQLKELDPTQLQQASIRAVLVGQTSLNLKRKLLESDLSLPSCKRLCLHEQPSFSPLPQLLRTSLSFMAVQTSLDAAGICGYHCGSTGHGSPCIHITSFPQLVDESPDIHLLLSSRLQRCQITPYHHGYHCTMVFSGGVGARPGVAMGGDEVILSRSLASGDVGQTLLVEWQGKLALLGLLLELQEYLSCEDVKDATSLCSQCKVVSFNYDQLTVSIGNHELSVFSEGLSLSLSKESPHVILQDSLQLFLASTLSLPLLLHGILSSAPITSLLANFTQAILAASVTATTPAQLQLCYDHFFLSLNILADSSAEFTGIGYSRPSVVGAPVNAQSYLQVFLQSAVLGTVSMEAEDSAPPTSSAHALPPTAKRILMPCPSPIMSPWPGSPLPSIPPLPSPADRLGGASTLTHDWSFPVTLEQLQTLLSAAPTEASSAMEGFLGSMAQLYHFIYSIAQERYQQSQQGQTQAQATGLQFVSSDRGLYNYRTESLNPSLAVEMAGVPSLKLTLRPNQENVWSASELQTIGEFFKTEISCPPYSIQAMVSFMRILQLPLSTFKSFAQLMHMHLYPPLGIRWHLKVCVTVPDGFDLSTPLPMFPLGSPGVIYKGKLLVFIKMMAQTSEATELVVPVLHDPKANSIYVVRLQNHLVCPFHQPIDSVLRKTAQEYPPGHHECSLFPALRALSLANLPI